MNASECQNSHTIVDSHYGNQFLSCNATDASWYDGPFTIDVNDDGFAIAAFSEIASAQIDTTWRESPHRGQVCPDCKRHNVIRGDVLVRET